MNRFMIVSTDSWKKQMKSGAFWFMVFMPFIMAAVTGLIGYFASGSDKPSDLTFIADSNLKPYIIEMKDNLPDYKFLESEEDAKKEIEDGKISAYANVAEKDGVVYLDYYGKEMGFSTNLAMENLSKTIQNNINKERASLSPTQNNILKTEAVITSHELVENYNNPISMAVFIISTIMLYMILMMYSNILIVEIATEKGTKMIEFIFSSVSPHTYFAGKIFGNLLVILTHLGIYIIGAVITGLIIFKTGLLDKLSEFGLPPIEFNSDIITKAILTIVFVVLGVIIYMILSAMMGSLVSKQEDAGKMSFPVIMPILISYFIALSNMGREANAFIKTLSYIPFFSSFFMPLRLINEKGILNQAFISLAVLVSAIILVYLISARVYKKNILNYSSDKIFGRNK